MHSIHTLKRALHTLSVTTHTHTHMCDMTFMHALHTHAQKSPTYTQNHSSISMWGKSPERCWWMALLSPHSSPTYTHMGVDMWGKSPIYAQKSPTYAQKSPTYTQNHSSISMWGKSPTYWVYVGLECGDRRAIHQHPKVESAAFARFYSIYATHLKLPTYTQKSPVYTQKSPVYTQKSPVYTQKMREYTQTKQVQLP